MKAKLIELPNRYVADADLEVPDHTIIEDIGERHDGVALFRPSAFYFRRALRCAVSIEDARQVGMTIIEEMEHLKEWIRVQGYEPGKRFVLMSELREKNAADCLD